ncbi:PspC domain-containing protein [Plantibacter sp. Mn2098]|uniref:ATP-binding protein n=1 Tax=Plantibacter sp. Mn2098 TaxID=3395266 RepID=UPI003BCC01C3
MTRPRHRYVGGVCAGFAEHTGLPVAAVRTATVILAACGGAGVLLYAWLWVMTPDSETTDAPLPLHSYLARSRSGAEDGPSAPAGREAEVEAARRAPVTEILLGIALLAAGVALVASRFGVGISLDGVVPLVIVLAGAGLAWGQFADLRRGAARRTSAPLVRILGALVLVVLGILLFFVMGDRPNGWTVVVAAIAVLLGVGVVVAPWALRLVRDLADERSARLREADRAEIAAHLHDSVLQTLALIQQQAGPASEASRLARAQERELRAWLFAGTTTSTNDAATELRAIAAVIETDYPARIEVVTVGGVTAVPEPFLAAAREAMLNAARHAGGDVSVYFENTAGGIQLSVTDRGPGFALDDVPDDRLGVRESIIGRMRRIGGTADLRQGPGGTGVEVRLSLPDQNEQTRNA